jgi:murein DD-endopeptidase MepM/ murein hydrolase activator NlpD
MVRRLALVLLLLAAAPVVVLAIAGLVRITPTPELELSSDTPEIGRRGKIWISAREPQRGLSNVKIELIQNGKTYFSEEKSFPESSPWKIWWRGIAEHELDLEIGKDRVLELESGEMIVRATAVGHDAWLRSAKEAKKELALRVNLTPPRLKPSGKYVSVAQGGCEVVTYEVGESSVRDGVTVRDWFFRGHYVPGGKRSQRFVLFAVPYDLGNADGVKLIAEDALGNVAESTTFINNFTPRPIGSDNITLDDKLLEKATKEILANTPNVAIAEDAPLIEKFKAINGDLRKRNNFFLRQLAEESKPTFLWKDNFIRMPGSVLKGLFADRRTYYYRGKHVDTQDHLGLDLASVERAPIPAANSGMVLFANYLGIFGNAVVIDHGFGLMSLYAHLSSVDVEEGEEVSRGATIGRTGNTGLSGGDHLHFTMLLEGMPVTPFEWWDANWIADRLQRKLGRALP